MSFINTIGTATAPYKMNQMDIAAFMQNFYSIDEKDKRRIQLMYEKSGIETRYSAIPDYGAQANERELLPFDLKNNFPSVNKRMDVFFKVAPQMCKTAILNCLESPNELNTITHLITVSCTGMAAPGLDLILLEELQLPNSTNRTSVNFMGCYAAFHALKIANAICKADADSKVLIVSVELCTLHFQKHYSMDNVAANLLFADGAAACILSGKALHKNVIELNRFYSEVMFDGKKDMAWHINENGFLMTLSAFIPQLIESGISKMLHKLLKLAQLNISDIDNWAIHPGGRKIIESIQKELQLSNTQVSASYDVLKHYGNMSSATILFVLQKMMYEKRSGNVFACGFGPGLTLETCIGKFISQ
ncbi:MAG: type III polyketide synthase [Bacteroidota bacterium]